MGDTQIWLESLRQQLRRLTPAQMRMLQIFISHPDEQLTRRQLAQMKGKRCLTRYDRAVLDKLVDEQLITKRFQRLQDVYGKPANYKGKNIALASRYYLYQLQPAHAPYHSMLKGKRKTEAPARKPVKPLYEFKPSWIDRIKERLEKIGL